VEGLAAPIGVLWGQTEELDIHGEDGKHEQEGAKDETLGWSVIPAVVVQLHAEASDLDSLESLDGTEEEVDYNESHHDEIKGENAMQNDQELIDRIFDAWLLQDESTGGSTIVAENLFDGAQDDADGKEEGDQREENTKDNCKGTHATRTFRATSASGVLKLFSTSFESVVIPPQCGMA
jgi:hypothetical protein